MGREPANKWLRQVAFQHFTSGAEMAHFEAWYLRGRQSKTLESKPQLLSRLRIPDKPDDQAACTRAFGAAFAQRHAVIHDLGPPWPEVAVAGHKTHLVL